MSCMVYEVWAELAATMQSIAPEDQQLMKPPATEQAITELEDMLGVALPADYRAFLKIHNGCKSGKLLFAFSLFSVKEIGAKTKDLRESLRESSRNFIEGGWDDQKLAIGDSHVGWQLAIDCHSGSPFVYAQSNYALPLAVSFCDYLVGLKDNLRSGNYNLVKGQIYMDEWGQR